MRPFLGLVLACVTLCVLLTLFGAVPQALADRLQFVSDLISTSAPETPANHRILFTTVAAVPPGGDVVVDFRNGLFMPSEFDITDIDFSTATTGTSSLLNYTDRVLATSTPGTSTVGVDLTYGSSTRLIFNLGSTLGLNAGETVRIELGTTATFGGTGRDQLVNPGTGPVLVTVATRNASDVTIDTTLAAIYIIEQVTAGARFIDNEPPVVFGLRPALDELVAGINEEVEFSLLTDDVAICKYDEASSTAYASMTYTMIADNASTTPNHRSPPFIVAATTTYEFFGICRDFNGNETSEFPIRFTIGAVPIGPGPTGSVGSTTFSSTTSSTTGGTGGGDGGGTGDGDGPGTGTGTGGGTSGSGSGPGTSGSGGSSSGGGGGGSGSGGSDDGGEFLRQASVSLSGWAYPSSRVTVLQDGDSVGSLTARSDGTFSTEVTGLERGTYTFAVYAEDASGVRSGTYNTTITLRADTENAIAGVVIPPTISVDQDEIDPGDVISVSGYAPAESLLEVFVEQEGRRIVGASTATTTAAGTGAYTLTYATDGLSLGAYNLLARARLPAEGLESAKSAPVPIGVGQAPVGDQCQRADINQDTLVDLTDFSILLFNWNTTDLAADINLSGLVELADFSIMLFCWSG